MREDERQRQARFALGNWARSVFQSGLQSVPVALAFLALAGVLIAGVGWVVGWGIPDMVRATSEWRTAHPIQRRGELAGALFYEMIGLNALKLDPQTGRIETNLDCVADASGVRPMEPGLEKITRRYCRSDIGHAVRSEIALWNRTVSVLAVRDDRAHEQPCDPKSGLTIVHYAPAHCHPAQWSTLIGPQSRSEQIGGELEEQPSPETFGFIARGVATTYGSWRRIDAGFAGGDPLMFETRVRLARPSWNVDVLGDVIEVLIDNRPVAPAGGAPVPGGYVRAFLCDAPGGSAACAERALNPATAMYPRATRLTFNLEVGKDHMIAIRALPIAAVPERIADLKDAAFVFADPARERLTDPDEVAPLTPHIDVICDDIDGRQRAVRTGADGAVDSEIVDEGGPGESPGAKGDVCSLRWRTREATTPLEPGLVEIRTRGAGDQAPLALTRVEEQRPAGRDRRPVKQIVAAKEADELGLLPIVGLDSSDEYALIGQLRLLAGPGDTRELDLSIDPLLQKETEAALRAALRRDMPIEGIRAGLLAAHDASRRAALVLIDAGQTGGGDEGGGFDALTGRVLAVSTYPRLSAVLSKWDVDALDRFRPTESPLAPRAWMGADRFMAPGSSFKPMVALAAIDKAARGDALIRRFLGADGENRGFNAAGIRDNLGARFNYSYATTEMQVPAGNDGATRVFKFGNAREGGGEERRSPLCSAILSGQCPPNGQAPVGLRDATVTSSNLWFGRLAVALDEEAVTVVNPRTGARNERTAGNPGAPVLTLGRMVNRVWPRDALALVPAVPDAPAASNRIGGRLRAEPTVIDAVNPKQPRRVSLALNGFGQAAQATPLAMASLMASIATGVAVYPRLTFQNDPRTGRGARLIEKDAAGLPPADETLAAEMMRGLRRSLADVVRHPRGTAHAAFYAPNQKSPLADRIYGKTGTAQVGARVVQGKTVSLPNTVWFIGWLDGFRAPGYEDRRVAFACAITHVSRSFSGGKTCAPLVRQWLERMEANRRTAAAPR